MTVQRKVCMLGTFAVGKTSLVARFVKGLFSEEYLTTIGVKVDRKTVTTDDGTVNLLLWDIAGDDEFQRMRASYLRGARGFLLVFDGTRPHTLDDALSLREEASQVAPNAPMILVANKADLEADWAVEAQRLDELEDAGWTIVRTSAKTGDGVEAAFEALAELMWSAS